MTAVCAALCVLCLLAYVAGRRVANSALPGALVPLASPPLVGAIIAYTACRGLRVDYAQFAPVTRFAALLLVPATMALAVPLYRNRDKVARHALLASIAVVGGSLAAMSSAFALARLFGLDASLGGILGIKSATAAISLEIAARHGLDPLATAALVVGTGLFGAVAGPYVFAAAHIHNPLARGLAYGATSHAIGTARAIAESELTGAVSGVALCVNGVLVALVAPLALWLALGR